MKYVWITLIVLAGALVLCLLAAVIRTLCLPRKRTNYEPSTDEGRMNTYAEKLSKMVQIETISVRGDDAIDKFLAFHALLKELFPTGFATCEKIDLGGNLLLKWKGAADQNPILLMGHMDVVEATGEWKYPPFSGAIAEGKVWGRGSADTKCSLMALLQAAEEMIEQG